MIQKLKPILRQYKIDTRIRIAEQIGSGHIHQTYQIITEEENHAGYILQKFNDNVFPDIDKVMENILQVTRHLRKNSKHGKTYRVTEPVVAKSGSAYYTGPDGSHWRLYHRITPGISFDTVPNESAAYEAGKIYGSFIAGLDDFPANLHEIIPGFHSLELRYNQLMSAIEADPAGRVSVVESEIRFAKNHNDAMREIPELQENEILPKRIIHNDTKLNNVLFDGQNHAVAVVDLDTVMPGLSLYDFGDLVRSAANTGKEDGESVKFSLPLFSAIAKGFLEETNELLTPEEITLLPLAPQYMTYLMGIRFLADYISGDIYYNISHPEQNLERCRAQFRLMESMMEAYHKAEAVITGLR